jgi:cytochrome c556
MMDSRARDRGDWIAMSLALVEAGERALRAAEARDKDSVFTAGGDVYAACTSCHAKYAVPLMRPSARK